MRIAGWRNRHARNAPSADLAGPTDFPLLILPGIPLMAAAPHLMAQPFGLTLLCLAVALAWGLRGRLRPAAGKSEAFSSPVRLGLLALGGIVILLESWRLDIYQTGAGFLSLLVFVKLLETRRRADGVRLILISLFLVGIHGFRDQSPWFGAYLALAACWMALGLVLLNAPAADAWRQSVKRAATLLGAALPIGLVLFLILPRPTAPWSEGWEDSGDLGPGSLRHLGAGAGQGGGGAGAPGGSQPGSGGGGADAPSAGWWDRFLDYRGLGDLPDLFGGGGGGSSPPPSLVTPPPFSPPWWLILLLLCVIVALLAWWIQRRRKRRSVVWLYGRFCRRMARLGVPRRASEGPVDYAQRAARGHPDLAERIWWVTRLYVALRYGPHPPLHGVRDLCALVDGF